MIKKIVRKNYFIKKDFQGKLILGFFLFVIGSIILFTVILSIFSADSMTISYKDHNLQFGQTPVMLLKYALAANWIFIIFGGSLLIISALLVSHHIAGPQFHFEETVKKMIDGDLNHIIHLRKNDEGATLSSYINTFNRQLSLKIKEIDKHSQSINELLKTIDQEQTDESMADKSSLLEKYQSIRRHNHAIRKVTTSFILADE